MHGTPAGTARFTARFGAAGASVFILAMATGLAGPAAAAPITWINPATGGWFVPGNWDAGVPSASDDAFINNGGTATSTGPDAPTVNHLYVGAGNGATPTGTLEVSGSNLIVDGVMRVGVAAEDNAVATGTVQVNGSVEGPGSTPIFRYEIGVVNGDNAQATGTVTISGNMDAEAGTSYVGRAIGNDSHASGQLTIGGNLSGLSDVGHAANLNGEEPSSATGTVTVQNGDLALPTFQTLTVGRAQGIGSTANGSVTVENGTMRATGGISPWVIGGGFGGSGTGSVITKALDTSVHAPTTVLVGQAGQGGSATGTFVAESGDLNVTGDVRIGLLDAANGGSATGTMQLADTLRAHGTFRSLYVGTLLSNSLNMLGTGTVQGTLEAAGIEGFRNVWMGYGAMYKGLDATANTVATIGAGGIVNTNDPGGTVAVGMAQGSAVNAQVIGPGATVVAEVSVNGDITGYRLLDVGRVEHTGTANGKLYVQNGTITVQNLRVGTVQNNVGITLIDGVTNATGLLRVTDGAIILTPTPTPGVSGEMRVGVMVFPNADINSAVGTVELNNTTLTNGYILVGGNGGTGTLKVENGSSVVVDSLSAGYSFGNGTVIVNDSSLHSRHDANNVFNTGSILVGENGNGTLEANNSSIAADTHLLVGRAFSSENTPTLARVALTNSTLEVGGSVQLGGFDPDGRNELSLKNSTATVGDNFFMGISANDGTLFSESILEVDSSSLSIGGNLIMDIGAEILFAMAGLDRGLDGYGAIDAANASLQGKIGVDFAGIWALANFLSYDFDLIITQGLDSITGDFDSIEFFNLPVGYTATYGIFAEDELTIWRVTLALRQVNEVQAITVLLTGLLLMAGLRRRASAAQRA